MNGIKTLIGIALATTTLGGAIAVGATATTKINNNNVEMTSAATSTGEAPLLIGTYDDPGENYLKNDKTVVWYWGSNITSKAIEVTKIHDRLAYVVLPKDVTGFKVCRVPASYATPNTTYPGTVYNNTGDITFKTTANVVNITGWNNSYTYDSWKTFIPKNTTVFYDTSALTSYNWHDSNSVPYMYAALDSNWYYVDANTSWNRMTRIGMTKEYYFTASSDMVLDTVIFTRNNPSGDPSWSTKWSQTTNVTANYGFNPYYVTKLNNSKSGDNENWAVGSVDDTANCFGDLFLSTITCNNGVTTPDSTKWGTMSTIYGTLSSLVQYKLYSGTASESGSSYQKALARYDYIGHKYGYTNFINRSAAEPQGSNMMLNVVDNKSNVAIIIVSISILGSLCVGGYFFLRKKKEQ